MGFLLRAVRSLRWSKFALMLVWVIAITALGVLLARPLLGARAGQAVTAFLAFFGVGYILPVLHSASPPVSRRYQVISGVFAGAIFAVVKML